jgi:hypothetical protein
VGNKKYKEWLENQKIAFKGKDKPNPISCDRCENWTFLINGEGEEPNLGKCAVFNVLKWYHEGKNCTEFITPKE